MKVLHYDLETARCIPQKGKRGEPAPALDPGLEYCHGWTDYVGMGIATLCAYQSWDGAARVFDATNIEAFHEACDEADVLASYNGIHFDNKVIDAHSRGGQVVDQSKCYDLRVELLKVRPDLRFLKGYNLESLCLRTLGRGKSGDGGLAPVRWQGGHRAEVINYCLDDASLVRDLFNHVHAVGYVIGLECDVAADVGGYPNIELHKWGQS